MALHHRKVEKKPERIIASSKCKNAKPKNRLLFIFLIIFAFVTSFSLAWYWHYVVQSRIYTPFPYTKAVEATKDERENLQRLWGTYRSHLYFGVRTRTPESILFGLLWFAQYPKDGQLHLRYTCEQGDNLPKYGWLQHNGNTYGSQEIIDEDFILTTEFLKRPGGDHGGDWTARVKGRARFDKKTYQAVSLMFAVTNEGSGKLTRIVNNGKLSEIHGRTPALGEFKIKFENPAGKIQLQSYLSSYEEDIYSAKEAISRQLQYKSSHKNDKPLIGLAGDVPDETGRQANFFVHQVTLQLPFQMDVLFESESNEYRDNSLTGDEFVREIQLQRAAFDTQFENTFQLKAKGYSDKEITFAKAAMSNMIGGIGFFHGRSKVTSKSLKKPIDYWETGLYTGVPSRSFFPRGFLWDEGFHQLLIQRWDPVITQQVLAHWLDLLNYNGWIPREQILGVEARRKVPDEFVVQHNENANPPTFFLTIQSLMEHEKETSGHVSGELVDFLKHVFPRLKVWFNWYNSTQIGKLAGSYRWHGRDEKLDRELNPKTLTSGLDDYPRASHPSIDERHVDLRCWIALASGVLADIAEMVNEPSDSYRRTELYLKDNDLLDRLHWSSELKSYADYGNHTKFTALEWVATRNEPNSPKRLARVVNSRQGPTLKFVAEFGYVSLFPFLLKILKPSSPKLKFLLKDIRDPNKVWTNYGLRSLSKNAHTYGKYNTEHDKPYWRGPIWININYLAVKALHHYSTVEGPYRESAKQIYMELRENLVTNLFIQYQITGYIWEQFDDRTGKGQGCYPFTGWSALVTLIMAEKY